MVTKPELYTTLAQVLPLVLLTIAWDRDWLQKLQSRALRTPSNPGGVRFWCRSRVRSYSIAVVVVLTSAISICILVLAEVVADATWTRVAVITATAIALATLLVRLVAAVLDATR
jgi:hypothetical protein